MELQTSELSIREHLTTVRSIEGLSNLQNLSLMGRQSIRKRQTPFIVV